MKLVCLAGAVIAAALFAGVSFAADQTKALPISSTAPSAAPFAPVVLSQEDVGQLTNYLGTLPYAQAAPIMNFLAAREAEAQTEARKNEKKK